MVQVITIPRSPMSKRLDPFSHANSTLQPPRINQNRLQMKIALTLVKYSTAVEEHLKVLDTSS
jgi:hypothetical protein